MEELGRARYTFDSSFPGTRVLLPTARNWFLVLFLMAWLGGWAVGELSAIGALFHVGPMMKEPVAAGFNFFLGFWLCGWTLGGAWALYSLLGILAGREEIRIQNGVLEHFKGIGSLGRTRQYPLADVKHLRAERQWPAVQGGFTRTTVTQAGLRFDYGIKTVELGWGLTEVEARQLLEELERRHGTLKERV